MRREIVIRDAVTDAVSIHLIYRMPGFRIRGHQDKTIENARYLDRLCDLLVPKLEVAAVLGLPIRRDVIKEIQHTVILPLAVVRIVDMRLQKMPAGHRAQSAGI